jgi:hypothetical protein
MVSYKGNVFHRESLFYSNNNKLYFRCTHLWYSCTPFTNYRQCRPTQLCIKLDMAVVVRELEIKLFIEGIIGVGRCQVSMK